MNVENTYLELTLKTALGDTWATKSILIGTRNEEVNSRRSLRRWADKQDLKYGAVLSRTWVSPAWGLLGI